MNELFTPEQLAEVAAYHRPLYLWKAVSDLVHLATLALVLRFAVRPCFRWAERAAAACETRLGFLRTAPVARVLVRLLDKLWGGSGWGVALAFTLLSQLALALPFLPLDVYFGFVHEHRFGLSHQSLGSYAWDEAKSWSLWLASVAALAFGLFGLARRLPRWWLWLGLAGGLLLGGSAALDPYRGRLFFEQEPLADGALRERIVALLHEARVDFQKVVVEKTSRASVRVQAYFAGTGATRTVVLTDTLVEQLSTEEVLAVVAHEAAHVHERRWLGHLGSALALLAFLYAVHRLFGLAARKRWLGIEGYADIRAFPLMSGLFFALSVAVTPVSAFFSRQRELAADRWAVALTKQPETYVQMLAKATRINKLDPAPPRWVVWRGQSHPPMGQRIEAVRRQEATQLEKN